VAVVGGRLTSKTLDPDAKKIVKLFTKKTEQKESEKMFYENQAGLLVDLKNYRSFARRLERERWLDELFDDLTFLVGMVGVMALLWVFLPVLLPL